LIDFVRNELMERGFEIIYSVCENFEWHARPHYYKQRITFSVHWTTVAFGQYYRPKTSVI